MKKPLKQVVQNHLESISLDDSQLETLMQLQDDHALINVNDSHQRISGKSWAVATAAMISVFILGIVLAIQFFNNDRSSLLIQKIANEVAYNHLKMKPMEVETVAINDVQNYFTKLDFLPQQSQLINENKRISLAGGRYCSIQGSTAAQLRYKDKQGGYVTLFETPYSPTLFKNMPDIDKGEQPITTYAKGIKVTLWREHGLLMVSTEKPEE